MVLRTCLYLARRLGNRPQRALVKKLMNQEIHMLLPLLDRGHCLSAMRVCSVILGQPLYIHNNKRTERQIYPIFVVLGQRPLTYYKLSTVDRSSEEKDSKSTRVLTFSKRVKGLEIFFSLWIPTEGTYFSILMNKIQEYLRKIKENFEENL